MCMIFSTCGVKPACPLLSLVQLVLALLFVCVSDLFCLCSPSLTVHTSSSTRENNGALHCVPVGEHEYVCVPALIFFNSVPLSLFQSYIFTDGEDKELRMRTGRMLNISHRKKE